MCSLTIECVLLQERYHTIGGNIYDELSGMGKATLCVGVGGGGWVGGGESSAGEHRSTDNSKISALTVSVSPLL